MDPKFLSVHPEDIELNRLGTLSKDPFLFGIMPNIFRYRNNCRIIYAGAVPGPDGICIYNVSDAAMRKYIVDILSPDIRLFFDDSFEGILFYNILNKIHSIIGNFQDTGIDGKQIYYVSGTANAVDLYKKYCVDNSISNPINIKIVNAWEYCINKGVIKNRFNIVKNKEKLFLCFNRILRPHRYALLGLLLDKQLVEKSYYSFFLSQYGDGENSFEDASKIIDYYFSGEIKDKILNQVANIRNQLPLKINIDSAENNKNYLDGDDIKFFDNSYFSLVTETNYFSMGPRDTVFFSEKIFKPIKVHYPFILVSCAHSLKYLRKMGYKTFSPFINDLMIILIL